MADESFRDYVLDQLEKLGPVDARSMFGAYGLYHGSVFFGIIHDGRLYLKTDGETRKEYESRGMGPFRPSAKQTLKTYYEVPVDILEDDEELSLWARRACECQS